MKSILNLTLLIISIFLAMILTGILWFLRPSEQVWGAIIVLMIVLGLGLVIFKNYYETNSAKHHFLLNYNAIILIVINMAILLTSILLLVDASGELLKTTMGYSILALGVLAIAGVVLGLLYGLFLFAMSIRNRGNIEDPNLFNEMQWALGNILRHLGFTLARQEHRGEQYTDFTKDELHVSLSWESNTCRLYVYDEAGGADNKKRQKPDFKAICRDYRNADKFKSETIEKLNEWLVKKKLK